MKKIISFVLIIIVVIALVSCASTEEKKETVVDESKPLITMNVSIGDQALQPIKIELYPKVAPNTVANFVELANSKFYDGLEFHRVIKDFMIQGGDPNGIGTGGPGYKIPGEFSANGFNNTLKHEAGVISMARGSDFDSAGSQFFICHKEAPHLDGEYAAFGKVVEGFENVDKIANVAVDGARNVPKEKCVMTKVSVDLRGYSIKKVEKN